MRVLRYIHNELFWAGLDKEKYRQVKDSVDAANQKAIINWSVSIGLFWLLSLVLSFYIPVYEQCRQVYIGGLTSAVFTWLCGICLINRYPWLLYPVMYLLTLSILMTGIGIAICQPHDRTATMLAMVVMLPTCFISPTIRSIVLLSLTILIYCFFGKGALDSNIFSWGLLNLFIFSLAGLLTGHMINKTRFKRYFFEDSTQKMALMQANFNDKLVMGMAAVVDSRDRNTGGHSRRTATGVRFLIDVMQKDESLGLSAEFCKNTIKAAPMHDIGKIAVDDVILRKPGKYTPEEYEQMKKHAAEGARILQNIFNDTDEEFCRIVKNVAHYHHERMDGTGYPDGLKGDEIPLEARIMAIADVYDALVSKRVYKDRYSFKKANQIILDGMGTQFDPMLQKYYEKARPRLEDYYLDDQPDALQD